MDSIKISVFTFFLLALAGCGGGSSSGGGQDATDTDKMEEATAEASETPELERLIVVIGDSIGTGFGASRAFPEMLQALTGIRVLNVSAGGTSAEFGAGRAPDLINRFRPMYLVALLGTNNATGAGGGVSGAVNSLQSVADIANREGVIAVIGTIPPITRDANENDNASAISSGIRGIRGARIAPINRTLGAGDIGEDGKHPNDSGQQKIAILFAQQIF